MITTNEMKHTIVQDLVSFYKDRATHNNVPVGERIDKAGQLYLDGKVEQLDERHFRVKSGESDKITYTVNGACSCPDEAAPEGWCKHKIAAKFSLLTSQKFAKLAQEHPSLPHDHVYGCGEHNPPPVECWQLDCPDGPTIACPICAKVKPSTLTKLGNVLADVKKAITDAWVDEELLAAQDRVAEATVDIETGEITESPSEEETPVPVTEAPVELSTAQYEEAPVLTPKAAPMTEAPVSLCITIKTPSGSGLTYTMRGTEDEAVLERLPAVLATMERLLKSDVDPTAGFIQRITSAFFPRKKAYSGK